MRRKGRAPAVPATDARSSGDEIVVRPARREDVAGAASLAAKLVHLHHAYDPARFMRIEPVEEGYARFLAGRVGAGGTVFLVAARPDAEGGEVVGYVLGGLEGRDWMSLRDACGAVHDLWVEEAYRLRGVAGRLLEEAVSALRGLGAPRVVLATAWANAGAQSFFERHGFRRTMIEYTREL